MLFIDAKAKELDRDGALRLRCAFYVTDISSSKVKNYSILEGYIRTVKKRKQTKRPSYIS